MIRNALLQQNSLIYLLAIVASALISLWVDASQAVINPDAICYLYSAEEFGQHGLSAAMHLCPQAIWPFYSVLIFLISKVTQLSAMNAAFCIDSIFSALTVVMFIAITKQLGGSRRVIWLSALVILFAHNFNILRQDIIRDHGFWAFYLTSVYFLMRFFVQHSWKNALAWSGSLLIATLFRIEGSFFLLSMPVVAWFVVGQQSWHEERLRRFAMLNLPILLLGIILAVRLLLHPQEIDHIGRVPEIWRQLLHGAQTMFDQYQRIKLAVSHSVMNSDSARDASLVVTLLLLVWYLVTAIGSISWIYAALVVYAWVSGALYASRNMRVVVWGYLLVNLVITFGFFVEHQFLAKRYLVAMSLILMLWIPFALDKLLSLKTTKQRVMLIFVGIALLVSALGGVLHFGHSKKYVHEAGDWISQNVPADAKLYTNDYQLMYYSRHFGNDIFSKAHAYKDIKTIANGQWKQYDYLALMRGDVQDETAQVMQEIHMSPKHVFVSRSGSHIYIYKIERQENKT